MKPHSEAHSLITEAQTYGATVLADGDKVRVKGVSKLPPPLVEKIKERRDDILALLTSSLPSNTLEPLPWQLQRLLNAASSGVLNVSIGGVGDSTRYAMAWGCAYLVGDKDEALKRLWEVYRVWQRGLN